MVRPLPMKRTGSRRGEPVVSLLFGVPSPTIASGTLLLLLLYPVVGSVGPPRSYQVAVVRVEGTAPSGRVVIKTPDEYTVPSLKLLGMLGVPFAAPGGERPVHSRTDAGISSPRSLNGESVGGRSR